MVLLWRESGKMMNLWEKNKREIMEFLKAKKRNILMLFCETLSITVASYFFIPFVITDMVEINYYLTPWYLIGIALACFGVVGALYSFITFAEKMERRQIIIIIAKISGCYIGLRVILAMIAGIAATIFMNSLYDIDKVKMMIDRGVQVATSPINAFLLLYFIKLLYHLPWKKVQENIMLITALFYLIELFLYLVQKTGNSFLALSIQTLISASAYTVVMVFVLYLLKQEEKLKEQRVF